MKDLINKVYATFMKLLDFKINNHFINASLLLVSQQPIISGSENSVES